MLESNDIPFTESDFISVSKIAAAQYGIQISQNKKDLLHARIARRMRMLGLTVFDDYMTRVMRSSDGVERMNFLSLLTTNTTSFFREPHHFKCLVDKVLPELRGRLSGNVVKIWSAGCSLGHEPYSIAATVQNATRHLGPIQAQIDATDIDQIVLRKARAASYTAHDFDGLTGDQKAMLFGRVVGGEATILPAVRDAVQFREFNLIDEFRFAAPYDVIFCRNVVIYFGRETQQQVWQKFLKVLKPGGFLFLGHSERLTGPAVSEFENIGLTVYRRRG